MAGRLRILTANLWNGGADPERLARLLEAQAVDVACFQELTPEQAEAVASVLPHGRLEPARDHDGMGIALRRPGESGDLPLHQRALRTARLDPADWPGLVAPLTIWNAHIQAPHSHPASLPRRRRQLRALLGHLADPRHARLVLVGDFNATPLWPVYRRVVAHVSDAAHAVATRRGERPKRTWAPRAGDRRVPWLRIDHVFVRGVEAEDVQTLTVAGSDHDGVLADLALEGGAKASPDREVL